MQATNAKRVILITGSRQVEDFGDSVRLACDWLEFELCLHRPEDIVIVVGDANGWDAVWRRAADIMAIHCRRFDADWDTHGKKAGVLRNLDMVGFVEFLRKKYTTFPTCWAFARAWDSGTGHCARAARKAGIPTTDYGVPTEESKKEK